MAIVCGTPLLVKGPPAGYEHRTALRQRSVAFVSKTYPKLLGLVEQGTLVVLERPPGYRERRTDGYEEPLELFLVGTAHVSAQSADDVRQVVTTVQPDAVVVELCRSRQAVMYPPQQSQQDQQQQQQPQGAEGAAAGPLWSTSGSTSDGEQAQGNVSSSSSSSSSKRSNPLGLSGGSLLPAFQRSLELGGSTALLLRLMLGRLSSRLSDRLGVQGGAEFIAAREEAEALGAQLVLGDRPIEITLQRAWDALSWRQRARLARELAGGALAAQQNALDAAAIEQLKDDDAVSLLFDQLSEAYPQLVGPLVHERDLYLAWSIKRSKAVNGARRVVAVVGKGHLRGLCYALTHDEAGAQLHFSDLVGGKNVKADRQRKRAAAVGRFALETALFGGLWYAWTALQAP
ncbi:hypothetical protein D9Q98_008924 [Chlorella vulgaris]|uniref:TraB domain-containing protein n=1 Tax=Chlorella vulgaris TaxID=3077 RepID=A0A9D4YTB6_CHLVU|nr:hypothetical protein D9Q98_008924 [Chlorella vulgaris]